MTHLDILFLVLVASAFVEGFILATFIYLVIIVYQLPKPKKTKKANLAEVKENTEGAE